MKTTLSKKTLRMAACVLSVCLVFGVLCGCANRNGGEQTATGSDVTLKWLLGGQGELMDSEEVWGQFNRDLQSYLPGTTVEFEVIPYADFAEKWKLISASREEVDLVWVGWMLDLIEEVRKGSFTELDSLLQYAPDLTEEIPESVLNLDRVGGTLYAIPNYQMITTLPYGAKVQGELARKHGLDMEEVTGIFAKDAAPTKEDFKIFEDYLEKLKASDELYMGVSKSFLDQIMGQIKNLGQYDESIVANAMIDWRSDELEVYDLLTDFPNNMDYFELANEWYKKGYIREDIVSLQDITADENKEKGYVLWSGSSFMGESERASESYGFDIVSIPMFQELFIPHGVPTTNTAISKTSADPVRSMQLLNLINTQKGKDLYNMLVFGLEGKHYTKKSDTEIEWLLAAAPGASSDNVYGYDAWAVGNTFNAFTTQFDTPGWNDYILNEVNAKATPSPLIGFSLDMEPIKLEVAQYQAIFKEYLYLDLGATDNYAALIAERDEKLKKAGSDKIIEEVQRQIDEWKKTK